MESLGVWRDGDSGPGSSSEDGGSGDDSVKVTIDPVSMRVLESVDYGRDCDDPDSGFNEGSSVESSIGDIDSDVDADYPQPSEGRVTERRAVRMVRHRGLTTNKGGVNRGKRGNAHNGRRKSREREELRQYEAIQEALQLGLDDLKDRLSHQRERERQLEEDKTYWKEQLREWEEEGSGASEKLNAQNMENKCRGEVLAQKAVELNKKGAMVERQRMKFKNEKEACEQQLRERVDGLKEWDDALMVREHRVRELEYEVNERKELTEEPREFGEDKCPVLEGLESGAREEVDRKEECAGSRAKPSRERSPLQFDGVVQ